MAVFRLQEHVPDVYARKSRDFQLLCNIFDCMNNAVKYDIDSIKDVMDTNLCNDRLLTLLQNKIGFFTNKPMSSDTQRLILKAFPYMVKNKGSSLGIKQAIYTFLKTQGVDGTVTVEVRNKEKVETELGSKISNTYIVEIGMQTRVLDTTILTEILKYIIPAGYIVKYSFNNEYSVENEVTSSDCIHIIFVREALNSGVRISNYEDILQSDPVNAIDTATVVTNDVKDEIYEKLQGSNTTQVELGKSGLYKHKLEN